MKRRTRHARASSTNVDKASAETTVQTAIRLPTSMLGELQQRAAERGVAAEIRARVQATLDDEKVDPTFRYLLTMIRGLKREVDALYGDDSWYRDSFAFQVMTESIKDLMAHFQPQGPVATKPNPETVEMGEFFEDDPPAKIARFVTRRYLKNHPSPDEAMIHTPKNP